MKCDFKKKKQEHYKNISINLMEQTNLEVEFIREQLKYLEEKKGLIMEQEPLKACKKAYQKWLLEMEDIDNKIFQLYNELDSILSSLEQK